MQLELAKGPEKKKDEKKEIDELALFRPVTVQKIDKGLLFLKFTVNFSFTHNFL